MQHGTAKTDHRDALVDTRRFDAGLREFEESLHAHKVELRREEERNLRLRHDAAIGRA